MTPALQSLLHQIRAIRHTAGEQLDDGAYREILKRAANVSSSTEIRSVGAAKAVLAEFARLGIGRKAGRVELTPMQKKMWALWQKLADAGLVNNRTMAGLLGYVKRQTGVDALRFMTWPQEHQIVESLKKWLERGETPSTEEKHHA